MTTVTLLPDPPSRSDPNTFANKGDAFLGALPNFAIELNLVAGEVNTNATIASSSASIASGAASTASAGANFLGTWASLGTAAVNKPASVSHSGKFWALLNNLANASLSQPGVSADWVEIPVSIPYYTYANRNQVRSVIGNILMIEDLGLFLYVAGSTEIDDDETCFASGSGRWLMISTSFEITDSLIQRATETLPELENNVDYLMNGKFLYGSKAIGVSTIAATSIVNLDLKIVGARMGDFVMAYTLASTLANDYSVSFQGRVVADDIVTVTFKNHSAAGGPGLTGNEMIEVLVIKRN